MLEESKKILDNYNIAWIIFFTVVVGFVGGVLDHNESIAPLSLICMLFGIVFITLLNRVENIKNAIDIFLIFFIVYLAYAFTIHFLYIEVYNVQNPYIEGDDEVFFLATQDIFHKFKENSFSLFDTKNIFIYQEVYGAINFYVYLELLSDMLGGEVTMLVQKVGVVMIAALIPSVMYSLSRLYFSEKISFIVATVYGIFSFVPYLSALLLRDVHVGLMFIITFYIILEKLSFKNLLILIFVSFFSYTLRLETGIFMMGFTSVYFFHFVDTFIENRYLKILFVLSLLTLGTVIVLNSSELINMFNMIFQSSSERIAESAPAGSMGAKVAKLPFGLNYIALLGFGQIQPFPPSLIFTSKNGFFSFTYLLAGIAWFFGWGFLLYGVFVKKILYDLDLKINIMFVFSIVYLVLVSVIEFNQRRQAVVYPILYLIMVFSYLKMTVSERTKVWVTMLMIYVALVLTFNYMKI